MTNITIAMVLKKISDDLDWRGPNDKTLGHVCLERPEAEYLHRWAIDLINAKDDLERELDNVRKHLAEASKLAEELK